MDLWGDLVRPILIPGSIQASASSQKRVVILPPISWLPSRLQHQHDFAPDLSILEKSFCGHDVHVEILDPFDWPWNPLHKQHPLLRGIDPMRALYVLLFRRKVDAIVCVFEGSALILAVLRHVMRFKPRLLLWDLGLSPGWSLRERIQRFLLPRVDDILVLGSNQSSEIRDRLNCTTPVTVVGHYIDTAFWREMPLEPSTKVSFILSVGDDASRDYDTLVASLSDIPHDLVIRSSVYQIKPGHQNARITIIRKLLSFIELRNLYASASMVVVALHDRPSAGGISAILEAAAMGRPLIVTRSAGINDWLQDNQTCLVVEPGDRKGLSSAIRRLLGDQPLRTRLGRAARDFVAKQCSAEAFAERVLRSQVIGINIV